MNTQDKVNMYRRLLRKAKAELRRAAMDPREALEKVNTAERAAMDAQTALFDLGERDPDAQKAYDLVGDAAVNLMNALHLLQKRHSRHGR